MKITAEFDSTDTAERACTAIKRSVSGIVGINIKGKGGHFENTSYRVYPAYSPANGNLSFSNTVAVQVPNILTATSLNLSFQMQLLLRLFAPSKAESP